MLRLFAVSFSSCMNGETQLSPMKVAVFFTFMRKHTYFLSSHIARFILCYIYIINQKKVTKYNGNLDQNHT